MWQADNNKAVMQRYVAAYNAHDLAAMDGIFASTYVDHAQPDGQPPQPPGPAFKKQIFALFFQSFPDAYLTLEDLVAEGDRVVARLTMSGTHQGAFMGIRPKGRRFSVPAINIFLIRDGMITDSWAVLDMMTLTQQIKGPKMVEFMMGQSLPDEKPASPEMSQPAPMPEYWARWKYSPEEWKRFDQLDWGRACALLLAVAVGSVAVGMGFVAFVFTNLYADPLQTTSPNYVTLAILAPMMLLIAFLLTYFLAGRHWLEARKRHQARKSPSRRVTIGKLSSLKDQGLWLAGTFIPLQEMFLELKSISMTQNPPLLHLRRKHLYLRQSSWYDTMPVLVPRGHEAEAAHLVERFRAETIASLKKPASPREP